MVGHLGGLEAATRPPENAQDRRTGLDPYREAYPWIGSGQASASHAAEAGPPAWRRPTEAIRPPEKAQDRRSEPEAWLGHPSSMNRQLAILRKFAIS